MIYLKLFQTEQERTACTENLDYVSYTNETGKVHVHEEVHDYSLDYLTLVATSNGTFYFKGTSISNTIQYSTDNGNSWSEAAQIVEINVNAGDKVLWKGEMPPSVPGIGMFSGCTATFDVQGNPMSLLYGDNFVGQTDLTGKNMAFYWLFATTPCVNANNFILPATTLADYCYSGIFSGCTSLITAPELPATTLANFCYSGLFERTSLTTAPELPATTLAYNCYSRMFYGCTNLNHITMLATDISANNCLNNWVNGVATSGTFVKSASMTTLPSGANGIPEGWTVQDA